LLVFNVFQYYIRVYLNEINIITKTHLTLCMVILLNLGISAQNYTKPLYLLFEFIQVKGDQTTEYFKVEDFWSGIHKQRVTDKSILGWDLWSLTPAGKEQGSQFLTVTLFSQPQEHVECDRKS
jgi:hypothetical protein